MIVFPLIAAITGLVFSALVFKQYLSKKRPYQLMWGLAFLMFSLASWSETIAELSGWTPLLAKTYYLFGASLVVGYLAMGTVYLMWGRKTAITCLTLLLIATFACIALIAQAPVDTAKLATDGWKALQRPLSLRLIVGIFTNGIGSLILIGGALYSAYLSIKRKAIDDRLIGTALIAGGALIIASGGMLGGLLGIGGQQMLSISITIGVIVMFVGFLYTGKKPRTQMPQGDKASA
jgi:hypothetical protein